VPEFRVKQDLLPGRTTTLRFTPTEPGTYQLACAEICGREHSIMTAVVQVVSREEFDAWIEQKINEPLFSEMTPEQRGQIWWSPEGFGCQTCHTLDGSLGTGPTWLGIYGREEQLTDGSTIIVDDEYIRNSIFHPDDQIVVGYDDSMPNDYEVQFATRQEEIRINEDFADLDILADLIVYMKTLQEQP
jgi:cytochrome c oxidase subunit 2